MILLLKAKEKVIQTTLFITKSRTLKAKRIQFGCFYVIGFSLKCTPKTAYFNGRDLASFVQAR